MTHGKSIPRKACQSIITSILLFLVVSGTQMKVTTSRIGSGLYEEQDFKWTIEDISEGTNYWINSTTWSTIAKWHAENASEITYTVDKVIEIEGNDYTKGSFKIGNLTLTTNDHAIGTNLALSYYPWIGGIISLESDWSSLSEGAPFGAGTNTSIDTETTMTILGKEVDTVTITVDDTLQQTELIYEEVTGILVYANTSTFGFHIKMRLNSSSIPLPSVTAGLGYSSAVCFLMVISILAWSFNIYQKKRRF